MKAKTMMTALTSMSESQLHSEFVVAKTGIPYATRTPASDKLVKGDVLANHVDGMQFIPGP